LIPRSVSSSSGRDATFWLYRQAGAELEVSRRSLRGHRGRPHEVHRRCGQTRLQLMPHRPRSIA
jgi:hypothetical protein